MKAHLNGEHGVFTPEQLARMQEMFDAQARPDESPQQRAQRARQIIAAAQIHALDQKPDRPK